jgi:hypothetical protein
VYSEIYLINLYKFRLLWNNSSLKLIQKDNIYENKSCAKCHVAEAEALSISAGFEPGKYLILANVLKL